MEHTTEQLVVSVVSEHADSLLRVARRYTGCAADAEDAYQRAMEIFVRNAGRLDPATAHKWLHVVVRHEAFAVREQRNRLVGVAEDEALDALDDGRHLQSVEERSERFDELARAAEALKRLKPQEVTALVLKAQGLSYDEIAARQGWTYTKVNRCLVEGRRAFLERYAGIEAGAECERWSSVLSAMADGEAKAADVMAIRPHLRNCPACRASLAEMQRAPAAAASLVPVALAGGLFRRLAELFAGVPERIAAPMVKAQASLEAASAGKVAAVAASAAAIAGGGVAVKTHEAPPLDRSVAKRSAPAAKTSSLSPATSSPASPVHRVGGAPAISASVGESETRMARDTASSPAPRAESAAANGEFAPSTVPGGEPDAPARNDVFGAPRQEVTQSARQPPAKQTRPVDEFGFE